MITQPLPSFGLGFSSRPYGEPPQSGRIPPVRASSGPGLEGSLRLLEGSSSFLGAPLLGVDLADLLQFLEKAMPKRILGTQSFEQPLRFLEGFVGDRSSRK